MNNEKFIVGDAIKFGLNAVKENLVLILTMLLISLAVNSVLVVFDTLFVHEESLFSIFTGLISILISFGLYLGYIKIYIDLYSNKEGVISDLFSRFDFTLFKFFVASSIYFTIIMIGYVALIIPGVILTLRFKFYGEILAEKPETGIIEALKMSWEITKGSTIDLLLLAFAIVGINILGILALVIGLFFTIPASFLAIVYSYKKLSLATYGGIDANTSSSAFVLNPNDLIVHLNKPKMKVVHNK